MRPTTKVFFCFAALLAAQGCVSSKENLDASNAGPSAEMAADSGMITGPAGGLRVHDGGQGGIPVIFVHSFAGDGFHWVEQLAHLQKFRRAIALDLRGHGASDESADGSYDVQNFAADIAATVDSLGLERFYLVGHSLGGAAALLYAGNHPSRVAGLLVVGAPGKVPQLQAEKIIRSLESPKFRKEMDSYWKQLTRNGRSETIARLESGRKNMPRERAISIIKGVFYYDPLPALKSYTGPRLALITTREHSPYALHSLDRTLPIREVEGASHWIHLDKPLEFNRILDEFLAQKSLSQN